MRRLSWRSPGTPKRDVAIKVLPAALARDPDRVARFEHEARAAGALNHPNIVAVYEVGRHDDVYWIATELVAGESLAKVVEDVYKRQEPLSGGATQSSYLSLTLSSVS